jgi:hypothetical protein
MSLRVVDLCQVEPCVYSISVSAPINTEETRGDVPSSTLHLCINPKLMGGKAPPRSRASSRTWPSSRERASWRWAFAHSPAVRSASRIAPADTSLPCTPLSACRSANSAH